MALWSYFYIEIGEFLAEHSESWLNALCEEAPSKRLTLVMEVILVLLLFVLNDVFLWEIAAKLERVINEKLINEWVKDSVVGRGLLSLKWCLSPWTHANKVLINVGTFTKRGQVIVIDNSFSQEGISKEYLDISVDNVPLKVPKRMQLKCKVFLLKVSLNEEARQ